LIEEELELELEKLIDDEEELEPIKYFGIFHPYFSNNQHKCI
ncbi:unnamed protein product, partial [marine sediment metagenome]